MVCILAIGFLFPYHTYAANTDDILRHNQQMSEKWVNWRPDTWSQDISIKILADQLIAEAENPKQIPQIVHDWICENIYYDYDAFQNGTYSTLAPEDVLWSQKGICESIANLTQALLLESSIPCIKVWGATIQPETAWEDTKIDLERVNHTWNEFYMDGRWITLDCTADMKNRFSEGNYITLPAGNDFYDPSEEFLALTHKKLYRGDDLPENMVSHWAREEVKKAVDLQLIPIELLAEYRSVATEQELCNLLGMESGENRTLQRWEAALMTAIYIEGISIENPYHDMDGYEKEVQDAVNVLYEYGIMRGKGDDTFYPNDCLTREEAICMIARIYEMGAE